jgi:hypothetical protein
MSKRPDPWRIMQRRAPEVGWRADPPYPWWLRAFNWISSRITGVLERLGIR